MDCNAELPSRGALFGQLIQSCLDIPPDQHRRDLPVVLLLGTRGSGKTMLLKEIHYRAGIRPRVLRSLNSSDMRLYKIAVSLAFGLSERVKQFGQLKFPRLALGLVAIRIDADLHNPAQARRNLEEILSKDRRGLITKLQAISEGLAKELSAPPGAGIALALAFEGAGMLWTQKSLRSRPFAWYRDARDVHFTESLHALLELHLLEVEGTQQDHDEVDKVLCRAFLADLRDAFAAGWKAKLRTGNCVALLDNADSPAGQAFLKVLIDERDRHSRGTRDDCDPLVVVAAGRTWFPGFALRGDSGLPTQSTHQATENDWASNRNGSPRSWLYPVELGDLDVHKDVHEDHPELSCLAREWPQATSVAYIVRKLHELTYGHLLSSGLMLRAVAAAVERDGADGVDLRSILDWPDPDRPTQKLADGIIDRLLPDASKNLRHNLVTCAAAYDVGIPTRWQALGRHGEILAKELDQFCDTDLWMVRDPMTGRGLVFHPFLRRVLLHKLGERGDTDRDRWSVVHDRLRSYYQGEGGDPGRAIYHTLALGDLLPVVAYLDQSFAALDKTKWLEELRFITAAPQLAETAAQIPQEQVWDLISSVTTTGNDDVLAQLVAAMWISKDPLGDPDRTLDAFITDGLTRLARRAGRDAGVLFNEAQRYQRRGQQECWAQWVTTGSGHNRQDNNA